MENQKTLDMQRQSPENTRTESRLSTCQKCGGVFTELWTLPELRTFKIGTMEKTIEIVPEVVEQFVSARGECKPCEEAREKIEREEFFKRKRQEQEGRWKEALGGEKPFRQFRIESYRPQNESQAKALSACQLFDQEKDNILLIGPTGVGKTHLACATVLNSAIGPSFLKRFRVTELLRTLRFERKAKEEEEYIKSLVEIPILLLEDLGAQKETDWGTSVLWEILDRRMEAGRNGLIVTSNIGRGKMAEVMGDRIPSRLSGICRVITIEGDDFRVKNPELKLVFDDPKS
jgi:DNA replication protein DnaC